MHDEAPSEPAEPSVARLVAAAIREGDRPGRSRLEPWTQVVFILRDKRWSFAAITAWLARHGVPAAESTVQRFYRSRCRDASPASGPARPNDSRQPQPFFDSKHETIQDPASGTAAPPASKPKFNTNF